MKWFYPLEVFQFDESNYRPQIVYQDRNSPINDRYRGGTAGFPTPEKDVFMGFGHYTLTERNAKHYPFIWKLNMKTCFLETRLLKDARFSNITDPITIIEVDKKYYLITAESNDVWFVNQDYITNVWEIQFD